MSKFDSKKVMPRYSFLAILMTLVAITVVGKTLYIMTAKRAFWEEVADRVKVDSLKTLPIRGNILSCDGQLMASSLPQYNIFMDFVALREAKKDTLFEQKLDSICMGLNAIFPDRSAEEFKKHLMEGFEKNKRHWPIWNRRINYSTFSEVKSLPVFNLSKNQSGFHWDEHNARKLAYGSLAGRTIGKMYGAKDTAQCGLELSYDSLLRGEEGIRHRRKVLNKYLDIVDTPPVNGADIVTTIDVSMQDLAERALLKELRLINANVGVAIVMEVKTGDVKAIVNMTKCADDDYHEIKNHAISDLLEPGSVFKTASIMVALDEDFDLLICGKMAVDGDTAQIGPELAGAFEIPCVTDVSCVQGAGFTTCGSLALVHGCDAGEETVYLEMPCAMTTAKEIGQLRMPSIAGIRAAEEADVRVVGAADVNADPSRCGLAGSPTQVVRSFVPDRDQTCETVEGTASEQAAKLAKIIEGMA